MKYYIGLGGIGCRTVHQYALHHAEDKENRFLYIDSEPGEGDIQDMYLISHSLCGTGAMRQIGRNMMQYELYTGKISSYLSPIREDSAPEVTIVTSGFGGFGGAAASALLDYLEALCWGKAKRHCRVIAFNEKMFENWGFPKVAMQMFEANMIEFVNEFAGKEELSNGISRQQSRIYNPGCELNLVNTVNRTPGDLWEVLDFSESQLAALNCRSEYRIKPVRKDRQVFISYSSMDQEAADLLSNALKREGITPWIATECIEEGSYAKQIMEGIRGARVFVVLISKNSIASEQVKNEIDRAFNRIRDGLRIIPFLLDDTDLDDECMYYLCRQEMFSGQRPPLEERMCDLSKKIKEILR